MKLTQISEILQAEVYGNISGDIEAYTACGSDLISDVLRFTKTRTVLLTGLATMQMVRTAGLLDLLTIVFVRGKKPTPEMMELANELGVIIMCTKLPLYESAGLLYQKGLQGCSEYVSQGAEESGDGINS